MIRFHPLSGILVLLAILSGQSAQLLVLFAIALWHELGHFAVARYFGWRIREILLLPFGGVLITDEASSKPIYQEILVTVAGPLQHLWLIILTTILMQNDVISPQAANSFIKTNIGLALFNLIPVQPLDGGKLWTAILSYRIRYHLVLKLSAYVSMILAAIGLLLATTMFENFGLAVNLLSISVFVIGSNFQALRNLPYHFRRFLLHRKKGYHRIVPILGTGKEMNWIVRRFVREKEHLIYTGNRMATEASVLHRFWRMKSVASRRKL